MLVIKFDCFKWNHKVAKGFKNQDYQVGLLIIYSYRRTYGCVDMVIMNDALLLHTLLQLCVVGMGSVYGCYFFISGVYGLVAFFAAFLFNECGGVGHSLWALLFITNFLVGSLKGTQ